MTKTPKLHTAKTNWQEYRNILDVRINISLKTPEEIEEGMEKLIMIFQKAARQATPPPNIQKRTKDIPFEIKKLIIEKRKARKKWQCSHSPKDKTLFNQLTNRLKKTLKEAQNTSFYEYVSSLNRYDNSIWRPIKNLQTHPKKILQSINKHLHQDLGHETIKRKLICLQNI